MEYSSRAALVAESNRIQAVHRIQALEKELAEAKRDKDIAEAKLTQFSLDGELGSYPCCNEELGSYPCCNEELGSYPSCNGEKSYSSNESEKRMDVKVPGVYESLVRPEIRDEIVNKINEKYIEQFSNKLKCNSPFEDYWEDYALEREYEAFKRLLNRGVVNEVPDLDDFEDVWYVRSEREAPLNGLSELL